MTRTKTENLMPEAELRRNVLTIRFRDREHQAVCDEAWRNRMSASGWLREVVLSKMEAEGKFEAHSEIENAQ